MSVFGRLFGTQKAIDDILDKDRGLLTKAGAWVGNLSYTEEDQAEAQERTRAWGLQQLTALAPFKVVQRMLAFVTATLWALVIINVLAALWVEALTSISIVEPMLEFALSDFVFWPVVAVFSLYYSGGVVESFRNKKQ